MQIAVDGLQQMNSMLQVLPAWAQKTLTAHKNDSRDLKTLEQLEVGSTGDDIWDALQHQLNKTGVLLAGHSDIDSSTLVLSLRDILYSCIGLERHRCVFWQFLATTSMP